MKKNEFLKELKQNLKHLQKEELEEVIADYKEHINIGISEGRSEKEVIKSLGSPKTIARHVTAHNHIEKAKKERTTANILRAVVSTIGVGFFNILFVVPPFLALVSGLLGLFIAGASLFIGGFTGFTGLMLNAFEPGIPMVSALSFLVSIMSAGALVLIAAYYISRLFYILTLKYLKLNVKVIRTLEG